MIATEGRHLHVARNRGARQGLDMERLEGGGLRDLKEPGDGSGGGRNVVQYCVCGPLQQPPWHGGEAEPSERGHPAGLLGQ